MAKHAKPSNESTDDALFNQASDDALFQDNLLDSSYENTDFSDAYSGEADATDKLIAVNADGEVDDEPIKRGSHIQANIDERKLAEKQAREESLGEQEYAYGTAFADDGLYTQNELEVVPSAAVREQMPPVQPQIHPHVKKSRRVRIILLIVIVMLLCAFGGLVYLFINSLTEVNAHLADEGQRVSASEQLEPSSVVSASDEAVQTNAIPELMGLIGLTRDDALALIGHGAVVTKSSDIVEKSTEKNSEGNETEKEEVVGVKITVSLKDDPTDKQGNTPSVYLKLNADGYITQAGFSSSLDSLSVSDCSFTDAVMAKNVVGDVLKSTGVSVDKDILVLPEDKSLYKTMSPDGSNVAEERYTFTGDVDIQGTMAPWTCTLVYDYSAKNVSGNLNDTIKLIYVYIGD